MSEASEATEQARDGESIGDEATAARVGEGSWSCRSFKASLTVATESAGNPGS